MRSLAPTIVLALALAALPLPGATAQEGAPQEGAPLLEDPKGDVALSAGLMGQGAAQPVPPGQATDSVDVVAVGLHEMEDAVHFQLQVASFEDGTYPDYQVGFTFGKMEYVVEFHTFRPLIDLSDGERENWACLVTMDDEGWRNYVECEVATLDDATATMGVTFLKAAILDEDDRMPIKGDTLEEIWGRASFGIFGWDEFDNRLFDVAPDEGGEMPSLPITKGEEAEGDLVMASEERVRVSNGGATTFVFEARVRNIGAVEHEVRLEPADLPEGWSVRIQSPLRVPGGEERAFTVLASVPFAHDHGGFDRFNVTATSASDAGSHARLSLGVLHTPIPQPAGHHPELYLHAERYDFLPVPPFGFTYGFMNTEADHSGDVAELPWNGRSTSLMSSTATWYIWLNPWLGMGLDFDLARLGSIEGSVFGRASGTGTMSAELMLHREGSEPALLAEADEAALTLALDQPTPFALTLTPTEESDYVPHARDQTMYLVLSLERDSPDASLFLGPDAPLEPTLSVAEFKMVLPLDEYHDRLTGSAETSSPLRLVADGPVERAGRPGAMLTYRFALEGAAGTFDLSVAGGDVELGELSTTSVTLAEGEKREVTLAVRIPADAQVGEAFEVLVFAHDRVDPSISAVARTVTSVAQGEKAEADESQAFAAVKDAQNETPAPGAALALAALALVGLALRRRR